MLGHGVGNLMTENNGKRSLVLSVRQQSLVHHNLATRHTESVGTLVLHKIEFPTILLCLGCQSVIVEISLNGCGKLLAYTLHHCRVGSIGRELGWLHIVGILLIAERKNLLVRHKDVLLATSNWHSTCCATRNNDGGNKGHQYKFYFFHNSKDIFVVIICCKSI